jgi:hypothetical protein
MKMQEPDRSMFHLRMWVSWMWSIIVSVLVNPGKCALYTAYFAGQEFDRTDINPKPETWLLQPSIGMHEHDIFEKGSE